MSAESMPTKVSGVTVDGLVVMKIIKYSADNLSSGSLCGLDVEDSLEVTHCFPVIDEAESKLESHQIGMLRSLREVNVDNNVVGWYKATRSRGGFCDLETIQVQYEYQHKLGPNAVLLVYDPILSSSGTLSLKAFRLQPKFMERCRDSDPSTWDISSLPHSSVLEELPVSISNSRLVEAFLTEWLPKSSVDCDFLRLELPSPVRLDRALKVLKDELEGKMVLDNNTDWKARTGATTYGDDVRVRSLLASVQIAHFAKQAEFSAGAAFAPLALDPTVQ